FRFKQYILKLRAPVAQILIGLALLSIPFITSPDLRSGAELIHIAPFQRNFLVYVFLLLFFYFNYHLLIPKLYLQKKYVFYALSLLGCFLIINYLPDSLISIEDYKPPLNDIRFPGPGFPPGGPPDPRFNFLDFRLNHFFQFFIVVALSLLISLNDHLKKIQKEKLIAEVSYLKAQINPHFLFNTLNSLYALALSKSDDAPEAILQLSSMMRYVVTESNRSTVPLKKELNYLRDYIELQRLRMTKDVFLSFTIEGDYNNLQIAPLILITYIENAFKYGINPDEISRIEIYVNIEEEYVNLNVVNKIVVDKLLIPDITEEGIKNTKKRLDHLYPGKYDLSINDNNDLYTVKLRIKLV
ncbi:MAG: sensor histidine kinase, partial [Leeuwenhoekiella sp.]